MKYMTSCSSMWSKPSRFFKDMDLEDGVWIIFILLTDLIFHRQELYAEMLLLEMWGDAVLKTLMAFVTIFVLFNLHLSPSRGPCLGLAFGQGNAAVLSSLTQRRKHRKNHLCRAEMDMAQEDWSQWGGFTTGQSSDPRLLSLHRRKFPRFFQFLRVFSEVPLKGCKDCACMPLFP